MKYLLETCDLSFYRGDTCVLEQIRLRVAEGQLLHIQGPNGAGKTTLLRMLAGVLEPTSGSLIRRTDSICYSGHQLAVKANLSVQENLQIFSDLMGACRNNKACVLAELALDAVADRPASSLSAGQKKRLSLARLLLKPAQLWLLDEPLSALDIAGIDWFHQLLEKHLAERGAVILSSHQPVRFAGGELQCLNLC